MVDIYPKHDVFKAIADPTRREMLRLLAYEEMPINSITGHFPMTRTAVTKHLHILEDAGLVYERRVGRETRYKLEPKPLLELKAWLAFYEQFWDDKLLALKNYVEAHNSEPTDK